MYCAVGEHGQTIDLLLTEHRDRDAARRFLMKAIHHHGLPETITIDGSDANEAAIKRYNQEHGTAIAIRQVRYLNNIVGQDHRSVKRVTRPMLGFKSFDAARCTLIGIELMQMLRKGQLEGGAEQGLTPAAQFYDLQLSHFPDGTSCPSSQNSRQILPGSSGEQDRYTGIVTPTSRGLGHTLDWQAHREVDPLPELALIPDVTAQLAGKFFRHG